DHRSGSLRRRHSAEHRALFEDCQRRDLLPGQEDRPQDRHPRQVVGVAMAVTRLGILALLALATPSLAAQARIGDLTYREGEVPVRLVGYGLVVGLDGTGDRSFGSNVGAVHTVRSVTNLLRRFNVEIPAERLRLRNVAAVVVTAELSPHTRP